MGARLKCSALRRLTLQALCCDKQKQKMYGTTDLNLEPIRQLIYKKRAEALPNQHPLLRCVLLVNCGDLLQQATANASPLSQALAQWFIPSMWGLLQVKLVFLKNRKCNLAFLKNTTIFLHFHLYLFRIFLFF